MTPLLRELLGDFRDPLTGLCPWAPLGTSLLCVQYDFQTTLGPAVIMAALRSRCGHYILPCGFFLSFFLSSPNLGSRRVDVYFDTWCGPSANLECRSETCCVQLAGNVGPKKLPKSRHLGTITQICWAISLQLRHISTIRKKTC